jgi:hypothetical protein
MDFKCYFIFALVLCVLLVFLGIMQSSMVYITIGAIGAIAFFIVLSIINFINNLADAINCFNTLMTPTDKNTK